MLIRNKILVMNDYFADAAGYDAGKEEWQGVYYD